MTQDDAYRMIQGFARAGVRCHMQRTTDNAWDVILDDRRLPRARTIHDLAGGRAEWRALQREGFIAA